MHILQVQYLANISREFIFESLKYLPHNLLSTTMRRRGVNEWCWYLPTHSTLRTITPNLAIAVHPFILKYSLWLDYSQRASSCIQLFAQCPRAQLDTKVHQGYSLSCADVFYDILPKRYAFLALGVGFWLWQFEDCYCYYEIDLN